MIIPQNPFFVAGPVPPEQFVGGSSLVNTAFDQILNPNRGHLAVYGSGMGKSSLLRFLAAPQAWQQRGRDPAEAFIVHLNCTDIDPFTPHKFWQEVLKFLKEKTDGEISLQSVLDEVLQEPLLENRDLRRVLRQIGQQNKFLLLLLDDYDAALRPNQNYTEAEMLSFLSAFRNLAVHSEEGRYFSTIVATSRRLNELGPKLTPSGSPWYNQYLFRALKPFSENEVTTLLHKMPPVWALTLAQQEGIHEISDGHPALLQNACYLLFDTFRENKALAAEALVREFANTTEQFFRYTWDFSTETEQMLLMLIALSNLEGRLNRRRQYKLGDIDLIFSQKERELRDLEERGIIERKIEQGKDLYAFTSSIMEWWVIKEIENSKDEAELAQREKVFLGLSRQQTEQIRNAIQQIWQNKDVVKDIVGWTGKLAGAFTRGFAGGVSS